MKRDKKLKKMINALKKFWIWLIPVDFMADTNQRYFARNLAVIPSIRGRPAANEVIFKSISYTLKILRQ